MVLKYFLFMCDILYFLFSPSYVYFRVESPDDSSDYFSGQASQYAESVASSNVS